MALWPVPAGGGRPGVGDLYAEPAERLVATQHALPIWRSPDILAALSQVSAPLSTHPMFRQKILPRLVWLFYRVLIGTWRFRLHVPDSLHQTLDRGQPVIFAHWHGHEMAILHLVKPFRLATMTSTSRDGQLIDYVIRKFGGATSRGSSTRGGTQALRGLVKLVRGGRSASMAVDGPRGPLHVVKPGAFELSVMTGAPIFPVGAAAARAHCFEKSWNKAILPLPFARVAVHVSEGWPAMEKSTDRRDPVLAEKLAAELHEATEMAARGLDPSRARDPRPS